MDAIFSPVKRVNWTVSNARVGQSTNYDRLTLEIWTDGTIPPEKALGYASKVLIDHLRWLTTKDRDEIEAIAAEHAAAPEKRRRRDLRCRALQKSGRCGNVFPVAGLSDGRHSQDWAQR